jgi:hypothetical protein
LNTEPLRADVLVLKKRPDVVITKNIADGFLGHNLFEYISPSRSLTVPVFMKSVAYCCLYQFITPGVRYDDVTLTLVCSRQPKALYKFIKTRTALGLRGAYPGITSIEGGLFPTRVIESPGLAAGDNIWLRSLRRGISAEDMVRVADSGVSIQKDVHIAPYMEALMNANSGYIRKDEELMQQSTMKLLLEAGWLDEYTAQSEARGEARRAW